MNTKYRIAIDLDGVLCDWHGRSKDMIGKTGFELREAGGDDLLWSEVSKHGEPFWSEMNWMEDGKNLFSFIRENFQDYFILSAQAKKIPESATGKVKWVRREIGLIPIVVCKAVDKQIFASENVVLVDDMERNIDQWRERGGIGIHHVSAFDTIGKLRLLCSNY